MKFVQSLLTLMALEASVVTAAALFQRQKVAPGDDETAALWRRQKVAPGDDETAALWRRQKVAPGDDETAALWQRQKVAPGDDETAALFQWQDKASALVTTVRALLGSQRTALSWAHIRSCQRAWVRSRMSLRPKNHEESAHYNSL
ncbi:unnamed protein product [Penicillium bialowiezense]